MPNPTPGSQEARKLKCCCPVLDNEHGQGAYGTRGKDAIFITNTNCPLHGNDKDKDKQLWQK
jgi:hypothetical protein